MICPPVVASVCPKESVWVSAGQVSVLPPVPSSSETATWTDALAVVLAPTAVKSGWYVAAVAYVCVKVGDGWAVLEEKSPHRAEYCNASVVVAVVLACTVQRALCPTAKMPGLSMPIIESADGLVDVPMLPLTDGPIVIVAVARTVVPQPFKEPHMPWLRTIFAVNTPAEP